MGTTTHYAFPYPVPADPANVPLDMQELADAIDSSLYTVASTAGGAVLADTVAGLGAGFGGKLGRLRLVPVTASVGSQALPIATLTVLDTGDFPSAGTLTTPNGTITYTGKTATTFTGCTGGVGTLATASQVKYASGTPPASSFDYLWVMYDSTLGKWVSPVERIIAQARDLLITTTSSVYTETAMTYNYQPLRQGYRKLDAAGLKPQLRFSLGWYAATADSTGQFRASFGAMDDAVNSGSTPQRNGVDPTAGVETTIGPLSNGANYWATQRLWSNIPAGYTVKDNFMPQIQARAPSGGGSVNIYKVDFELRWVG